MELNTAKQIKPTDLELVSPVAILEPHDDDAFLNLAGLIKARPEVQFDVYTLSTCVGYNEKRESMGWNWPNVKNFRIDLPDINFRMSERKKCIAEWYGPGEWKATDYHSIGLEWLVKKYTNQDHISVCNSVMPLLRKYNTIFKPLGLVHPMHKVASGVLSFHAQNYFYREYPYFMRKQGKLEMEKRFSGKLESVSWPVDAAWKANTFLSIYKSQWFLGSDLKKVADEEIYIVRPT